jgi:hypothetical protein
MIRIWQWFVDLHNARQSNGMGVSPLSYSEMLAWSVLTGNKPTAEEIKAIKRVDLIAIKTRE